MSSSSSAYQKKVMDELFASSNEREDLFDTTETPNSGSPGSRSGGGGGVVSGRDPSGSNETNSRISGRDPSGDSRQGGGKSSGYSTGVVSGRSTGTAAAGSSSSSYPKAKVDTERPDLYNPDDDGIEDDEEAIATPIMVDAYAAPPAPLHNYPHHPHHPHLYPPPYNQNVHHEHQQPYQQQQPYYNGDVPVDVNVGAKPADKPTAANPNDPPLGFGNTNDNADPKSLSRDEKPTSGSDIAATTSSGRKKNLLIAALVMVLLVLIVVVSIMVSASGGSGSSSDVVNEAGGENTVTGSSDDNASGAASVDCAAKSIESSINTATNDRATLVTDHINCIKLSSGTLAVPISEESDSSTAEEKALSWLIYDDPLQLSPDIEVNQFRLEQRYALLTLLLQNPDFIVTSFNETECEWSFVRECAESTKPSTLGANIVTDLKIWDAAATPGSTLSLDLGLLSHLVRFSIKRMGVTGSIPSSLGTSWTDLEEFYMYDNALTGSLPSSLGTTWTNLQQFDVGENILTGSLPSALGTTWSNLERFSVAGNDLKGSLPPSLGAEWSNITIFYVSSNALTGTIPNLASNWNQLGDVYFYTNNLSGSMPDGFCTKTTVYHLSVDCDEVTCSCCTVCCSDAAGDCGRK